MSGQRTFDAKTMVQRTACRSGSDATWTFWLALLHADVCALFRAQPLRPSQPLWYRHYLTRLLLVQNVVFVDSWSKCCRCPFNGSWHLSLGLLCIYRLVCDRQTRAIAQPLGTRKKKERSPGRYCATRGEGSREVACEVPNEPGPPSGSGPPRMR